MEGNCEGWPAEYGLSEALNQKQAFVPGSVIMRLYPLLASQVKNAARHRINRPPISHGGDNYRQDGLETEYSLEVHWNYVLAEAKEASSSLHNSPLCRYSKVFFK